MRARHPGFSWALHVVGSLTVIALALLSAAVITGSVVYVINDASEPPSETSHAAAGNGAQPLSAQAVHQPAAGAVNAQGKPVRIVDPAFPPPSPNTQSASGPSPNVPSANTQAAGAPAPVAATAPPQAAPTEIAPTQSPAAAPPKAPAGVAQSQSTTDVVSHKEDTGTDSSRVEQAPQKAVTHAEDKTPEDKNNAGSVHAASRYPAGAKKRATVTNTARSAMQASDQAQSTARRRVYDYYSSDDYNGQNAAMPDSGNPAQQNARDPRAQRGLSKTKTRVIVRRQDDYDDQYGRGDDGYRAAWPAQPRPRQSFFGFFGRDRSDNWRYDDRD
jgi:hypothetical protein